MKNSCVILVGLSFFLFLAPPTAFAENGTLTIDDAAIHTNAQRTGAQTSIGYQVAPDLFLPRKKEQENALQEGVRNELQTAKNQEFTRKKVAKETIETAPIRQTLFQTAGVKATSSGSFTGAPSTNTLPAWLFWLLAGVGTLFATVLGILLGKKYARIFRKKNRKG